MEAVKGDSMQIPLHDPLTAIYVMMFGAFFAIGAIEVVCALYRSILLRPRIVSAGGRPKWHRIFLIAMMLLGWGAVLLGTYWVYPQQALVDGSHARGSHQQIVEWKERLFLTSAIVMTMVGYVLIRYQDADAEQRRLRAAVSGFGLIILLATGTASALGAWAFR
jgi:hypothetical protein